MRNAENTMPASTTINISPAGIFVEEIDGTGAKTYKEITLDDLQSIFEKTTIETPILPLSTTYYNRENSDRWSIACTVPPQIRKIRVVNRYEENGSFVITTKVPHTHFAFRIENRRIVKSFCCCTKYHPDPHGDTGVVETSLISEAERLRSSQSLMRTPTFLFPFGNTWEDFRICWGNITLPEINSPSDIPEVIEMFFNGAANGDLFRVLPDVDFITFMRELDGKTDFDYDTLYPHNRDFGDFIRCIQ